MLVSSAPAAGLSGLAADHRFEPLHERTCLVELALRRAVLQSAREVASDRRKLRRHSAAFVSRFAQARRVLITQRVSERGQMLRDARASSV
ncbi:MAG TPA: hypothetical protein VH120_21280 [Gemmataceae bacterium]|nr:hypothetical protein [Gemmataceae bacterium]